MANAFLKEILYAARALLKDRTMTLAALITLSLGVSAPIAWYALFDKVILRPLPFDMLDRLGVLYETNPQTGTGQTRRTIAAGDFMELKARGNVYDAMAAYQETELYLSGETEPELVDGCLAAPGFFETLGVIPLMGRTFLASEGQPGQDRALILSYKLWQTSFAADPNILDRRVIVNGREYTVVGVMPANFDYPVRVRAWAPLALTDREAADHKDRYVSVICRLKPDVTITQAQADTDILMKRLEDESPQTNLGRRAQVVPLGRHVRGDISIWFGAIGIALSVLVLLVCCINIAVLQLARVSVRQREFAIRAALGATRWQIARLALNESMLLSLVGGVPAILMAYFMAKVLTKRVPAEFANYIAGWYTITIDARVLAVALLIVVVAGLLSGVAPAIRASKVNLNESLKQDLGSGSRRYRFLQMLVVLEFAVTIAALAGTASLLQGFLRLPNKYAGLDPDRVLTLQVSDVYWGDQMAGGSYSGVKRSEQMFETIKGIAGVESVAAAAAIPSSQVMLGGPFVIKASADYTVNLRQSCLRQVVSNDFFSALRIRLVSGREFTREDHDGGRRVAIISQSLARRYFQGRDPIGQELKLGAADSANPWLTIVGVVSDVTSFWFDESPRPIIYLPFSQNPLRTFYLAVRTSGDPMQAVGAVVSEIKRADKSLAVAKIKSFNQFINEQISGVRVASDFAFFLVIISLLLAVTGVFGMTTISVAQRTREIGLRMAIGAHPSRVRAMVVVRSLKLVAFGVAVGLPLSIATSASMGSFLWGVGRFNLLAMAGQILLLVAVGLISSYVPAVRASTINPVQALQCE